MSDVSEDEETKLIKEQSADPIVIEISSSDEESEVAKEESNHKAPPPIFKITWISLTES